LELGELDLEHHVQHLEELDKFSEVVLIPEDRLPGYEEGGEEHHGGLVRDLLDIKSLMCESLKSLQHSRIYIYRHSNTLSNFYPTPGTRWLVELRDMETMILEGRHEVLTGKIM
jgi:hypothetical protein